MNPDDDMLQVSHESIYTEIYAMPRGELRKELIACLRQSRKSAGHAPVVVTAEARFPTWSISSALIRIDPLMLKKLTQPPLHCIFCSNF